MKKSKLFILLSSITLPISLIIVSCSNNNPESKPDIILDNSSEEYLSLLYGNENISNIDKYEMISSLSDLNLLLNLKNVNNSLNDRTSQSFLFDKIISFYSDSNNKINTYSYIGYESDNKFSKISSLDIKVYDNSNNEIEDSKVNQASKFKLSFILQVKLNDKSTTASRNFNFEVKIDKMDKIADKIFNNFNNKNFSLTDESYNNIIQRINNTDTPTYSKDITSIFETLNEVATINGEFSNLDFDSLVSSSIIIDKTSWKHGFYSENPVTNTNQEPWAPVIYDFSSSNIDKQYKYLSFDIKYLKDEYANYDLNNYISEDWFENKTIRFNFEISISENSKSNIINFIEDNILKQRIISTDNYVSEIKQEYNSDSSLKLFYSNDKLDLMNSKTWINIETNIFLNNNKIEVFPESIDSADTFKLSHKISISNYSRTIDTIISFSSSKAEATYLENISQYDHFKDLKENEHLFISAETYNYLNKYINDNSIENIYYSYNNNKSIRDLLSYINSDPSYIDSLDKTNEINNSHQGLFKSSIKKWPSVIFQDILDESNNKVDFELKIDFDKDHDFNSHKRTYSNKKNIKLSFKYNEKETTINIPYVISNYVQESPESSYYALLDSYNWSDNNYKLGLNIQQNINDILPIVQVSNTENNIFGIMWTNFGVEYEANNKNYLHPNVIKHAKDIIQWYGHYLTSNRDFTYKGNFFNTEGFYLENLIEPTTGSSYVIQGHNNYTDFFIASNFQLVYINKTENTILTIVIATESNINVINKSKLSKPNIIDNK